MDECTSSSAWKPCVRLDRGHIRASFEHFARLHEREAGDAVEVVADRAYGPDPRHRLDLYRPVRNTTVPAAVMLFVHGGGFVGGHKVEAVSRFWGNVGRWAAGMGFLGAVMTYRLAPGHGWPAGAEDVGLACSWLVDNAPRFGVDSGTIHILGQSAGATHVAGFLAGHGGEVARRPASVTLVSGIYEPDSCERSAINSAYFGTDADWRRFSMTDALARSNVPILLTVAEFDLPDFQRQARVMQKAFDGRGGNHRMVTHPGHDHLSTVLSLGLRPRSDLDDSVRAFLRDSGMNFMED